MNRKDMLEEAKAIISADRQNDYGTPERNFETIAELWTAYGRQFGRGQFAPHEVAIMLGLVKVARLVTSPQKADNWIDLAGYAACGAEVAGAE